MITNTMTRNIESTLRPLDEAQYHFDPKNMRHIAAILREMYTDPLRAVVREYTANAVDAHVQAGIANQPIEVTVPSMDKPEFIVRDYGPGLDDNQVKELLLGYGSSGEHKRLSDNMIGGFGIGAKCGFAIADQFTFTSYYNGKKSVWLCYRDEDDDCRAKKIGESDTSSPNGIEVKIPVPADQIVSLNRAVSNSFTFFKVKPAFFNAATELEVAINRQVGKPVFSGDLLVTFKNEDSQRKISWSIVNDLSVTLNPIGGSSYRYNTNGDAPESVVVMGQIYYPLDMSKVFDNSDQHIKGLIIHAPIGSLQLAPSRESLSYTPRVKETIKGIVKHIYGEVEKSILAKVSQSKTAREMFDLIRVAEDSLPKDLRKVMDKKSIVDEFLKKKISSMGYEVVKDEFERVIQAIATSHYNTNYRIGDPLSDYYKWSISYKSIVYVITYGIGDKVPRFNKDLVAMLGSKLYPNCMHNGAAYQHRGSINILLCSESNVPDIPWIKDGSVPTIRFADLPVADAQWMSCVTKSSSRSSRSGGSGKNFYSQHSKKFSKLTRDVETYGGVKSEAWEAIGADSLKDKEKIVFVYHDRFVPSLIGYDTSANNTYSSWEYLSQLGRGFDDLKDGIYGIRIGDKDWVEKNKEEKNLVEFKDYVLETINRIQKEYDVTRDQLEALFLLYQLSKDSLLRGSIPFILGASKEMGNDTGLYALLNTFREEKNKEIVKNFIPFLNTSHGRFMLKQLGWELGFNIDHSIKGNTKINANMSNVNKTFHKFVKRMVDSTLCYEVMSSVQSTYWDGFEIDSLSDKYYSTENMYKLMLEIEKLKL